MPLINNPLAEAKTATTIMIKTREKKPEQAQNPKEKQAPKTQKAANVAAVPATAKPLILVSNVSPQTTTEDLEELFRDFGSLLRLDVDRQRARAQVEYSGDAREATDAAAENLDGVFLGGAPLHVRTAAAERRGRSTMISTKAAPNSDYSGVPERLPFVAGSVGAPVGVAKPMRKRIGYPGDGSESEGNYNYAQAR